MSRSFAHPLRRATLLACAIAVVPISISPVVLAATKTATKTANAAHGYAQRADVRTLVDELVAGHQFDRHRLLRWFAAAQFQPKIIAAMERPIVAALSQTGALPDTADPSTRALIEHARMLCRNRA